MSYNQIKSEARGEVQLLTLNRPERLNAWTPTMAEELVDAIGHANDEPSIGAIVLTGEGRGFCGGADMEATFGARLRGDDMPNDNGGMPDGVDWVQLCRDSKPMVAAVNGACVGIGLTQILPFDVIVAGESAKFGMFFIKVGLVPELASTYLLTQRMGFGHASEMCLSGRLYPAEEAGRIGLVEHVVPDAELLDSALSIASGIAANPAPQLAMIKELLTQNATETDLRVVQRRESDLLRICWTTPEHKEAVAAFTEKRPPVFPPRRSSRS
jgi:enoyl-CoA hydratase/carnithine racemase